MSDAASIEIDDAVIRSVERACLDLYHANRTLAFHGWFHIRFVRAKAIAFAKENGANPALVELAALTHDLNYFVGPKTDARHGEEIRRRILADCGLQSNVSDLIEEVVQSAETKNRQRNISLEAQALSDADTMFKALPFTPVMLSWRYMQENDMKLADLAKKILGEQQPISEAGYYFYSKAALDQYSRWAAANLELWRCVQESLSDPAALELLKDLE